MMSKFEPTLCAPDAEKSCVACCPPIRPAGYEHIQYKGIVKRMLRENTMAFAKKGEGLWPITGFSCWALGYLDQRYRLVGCLLHPFQNNGEDLRYRVDYGEKCERECCPEAGVFLELGIDDRKSWLHLADGLDSFAYSSKKFNPLFRMMGWGAELLHLIALNSDGRSFIGASFSQAYPFFSTRSHPRGNAYILNTLVRMDSVNLLKAESFRLQFEAFSTSLSRQLREGRSAPRSQAPHTHLAGLDPYFLDFLRLSVGITRIDQEGALRLKEIADRAIERFHKSFISRS
jgi:hypothetical protein